MKISKNKKIIDIDARIRHAKNQHPTTKTVTCRGDTDRQQTDKQTHRQR